LSGKEKETYPELADHLVFRLKRRIGRLRTLLNLVWRLCAKHERNQRTGQQGKEREESDRLFHRRMTVETLARSLIRPPRQLDETEDPKDSSLRAVLAADEHWEKLKDDGLLKSTKGADEKNRCQKLEAMLKSDTAWNWNALAEAVKKQIEEYMEGVPGDDERQPLDKLLVKVIEFCLPLRGRHWGWNRSSKARLHWDNKDDEHTPHIMGMRGLSMKRLEQISNLRQRCQSFAKLEDRYHGSFKAKNYNPPETSKSWRLTSKLTKPTRANWCWLSKAERISCLFSRLSVGRILSMQTSPQQRTSACAQSRTRNVGIFFRACARKGNRKPKSRQRIGAAGSLRLKRRMIDVSCSLLLTKP
jgi:hypothetical protein